MNELIEALTILSKYLTESDYAYTYPTNCYDGEYEYYRSKVELNPDEKANTETFEKKVNSWGCSGKEVLSWSLEE